VTTLKAGGQHSEYLDGMVLMVKLAWGITVGFLLVSGWLSEAWGFTAVRLMSPCSNRLTVIIAATYRSSWMVVMAAFSTVLALGLAKKPSDLKLALSLAWPMVLVYVGAVFTMIAMHKFYNARPLAWSMWFLLYSLLYVPVFIRAVKDERKRWWLYRAALFLMLLLVAIALWGIAFFANPV